MHQVGLAIRTGREVMAGEQARGELRLQLAHAVADGAGRHVQFLGGQGHAAQPGQGLKGLQAVDGRDARG